MSVTENQADTRPVANSENVRAIYPDQIVKNAEIDTLRECDEDSVAFQNLVQSIKAPRVDAMGRVTCDHGLLNPISVRPVEGRAGKYALIDGMQRWTAWRKSFGDTKPIPAFIVNLDDDQVLEAQLEANVVRIETMDADKANQILKIMSRHPDRTLDEQALRLHVETAQLRNILSLTRLPEFVQKALNEKVVPISVGYVLARFNPGKKTPVVVKDPEKKAFWEGKQKEWLERYVNMRDSGEPQYLQRWMADASSAISTLKKELKKGKDEGQIASEGGADVAPAFTLRKKSEVEIEFKRQEDVDTTFSDADRKAAEEFVETYPEAAQYIGALGYKKALQWVGQVDPDTLAERKAARERKENEKKEASDQKKAGKKSETIARSRSLFDQFGTKKK